MNLMLSELVDKGFGVLHGRDVLVSGVSIDTRSIIAGNLYFAISGPNFDGHDFTEEAIRKGASAVVVERDVIGEFPKLKVNNVREAIQKIASFWKSKFDCFIVAVTGSNGKTTVKEMIANIFSERGKTLATEGNLNNELGVPLTLFKLNHTHNYAVIEIGANHIGEIAALAHWIRPHVSVITMIGSSHLEGFGSIEGIATAKSEIYSAMDDDGVAVINRDGTFFESLMLVAGKRTILTFGFHPDADVRGEIVNQQFTICNKEQSISVKLKLLGKHNQLNSLAAAAVTIASGIGLEEIKTGLEKMIPVAGRLAQIEVISQYCIIDDSYNANPASAKAAIDVLASLPGKKCLVLGDMKELGENQERFHSQVGEYARDNGIDYFFGRGELVSFSIRAFGKKNSYVNHDYDKLAERFLDMVPFGSSVLVKGSRSGKMEHFIDSLKRRLANTHIQSTTSNKAISP